MEIALAAIESDLFAPGFQHVPGVFSKSDVTALLSVLAAIPSSAAGRRWAGPELAALLRTPAMETIRHKIDVLLPGTAILRAVAFRKDADANWFVPAHQDRSIPVPSAAAPPGFSNVTRKDGGWQAEAPVAVLEAMRNCRIFVDPATLDDGPLEVIPGSHRRGRITQAEIQAVVGRAKWLALTGAAGDLVILSPLLLHRSRRATEPSGRRVLQLECIPEEMASTLQLDAV